MQACAHAPCRALIISSRACALNPSLWPSSHLWSCALPSAAEALLLSVPYCMVHTCVLIASPLSFTRLHACTAATAVLQRMLWLADLLPT